MSRVNAEKVAAIVRDAGGKIIGRTRLQKIVYLLTASGFEDDFSFSYRHYGPYSEDLAVAARYADLFELLDEEEKPAAWGGFYSIYTSNLPPSSDVKSERHTLIKQAAKADAVVLELAATAVYLAQEGEETPWAETKRRKPDKSKYRRLDKAKRLYNQIKAIKTPKDLPDING